MTNRKANRVLKTLAVALVFFLAWVGATKSHVGAATGPADYIEGAVTSSNGPEPGVW